MKTGIIGLTAIAGIAAFASIAFAAEPGDPTRGFAYASSMCGSCHSVAAEGASPVASATPLRSTSVGTQAPEALANFVNTVHAPIAAPHMKDSQAADIAAYVASLKSK